MSEDTPLDVSVSHGRNRTVLLAEDDDILRYYLRTVLSRNRFDVLEASNGREAIDIYKDRGSAIHVILSDIGMPDASGEDLAKTNSEERNIPFVACTALVDRDLAFRLLRLGVRHYILKPFNEQHILNTLRLAALSGFRVTFPYGQPHAGGNLEMLEIGTRLEDLSIANTWLQNKLKDNLVTGDLSALIIGICINNATIFTRKGAVRTA